MCTVSILPIGRIDRAIRIVFNRDELDARAPAQPPVERSFGQRRAICPIDPLSGGTWIGANDAGIAFCALNVNQCTSTRGIGAGAFRSRGTIIPLLLECGSTDEATERAMELSPRGFQPFRLLIIECGLVSEIVSEGRALRAERTTLSAPMMRCSSGLGDEIVQTPRRELFDRMLGRSATAEAQDEFHRHYWTDRRDISVCMLRADARTVSRTTVELSERGTARMHYEPIEEHSA